MRWTDVKMPAGQRETAEEKAALDKMRPRDFIYWLCGEHTPAEVCVLLGGLARRMREAKGHRVSMRLLSLEFRQLELEARIGRIPEEKLDRLIAADDARTLVVEAVMSREDGAIGAACYVDADLVGVFGARDVIVLEW